MESINTEPDQEMVPSEQTQIILNILKEVEQIVLRYFKTGVGVEYKKDAYDPVTIADKEADKHIREAIARQFPGDAILSEESEIIPENFSGRVWMIDPLNGTKSFIKGSDTFAVVMGLVEDGVPVLGCVSLPAQKITFHAERGAGSFKEISGKRTRLQSSLVSEIEQARLITREPSAEIRPLEQKVSQLPFLETLEQGSGAKLCMIANGEAEAHINTNSRASKWDIAALQLILEEAGGKVTDLDGKPINYTEAEVLLTRSYVASANSELHSKIIAGLRNLEV